MTLSQMPRHSAQEAFDDYDTISARRVPNPEAFEALNVHLANARSKKTEESEAPIVFWQPSPFISARTQHAREWFYTRRPAARRYWKRKSLRRSQHRTARRRRSLILNTIITIIAPFVTLALLLIGLVGASLLYYVSEQNALANIAQALPEDNLKIYDANGTLIYELADQGVQTTIPLNRIPQVIQHATIAIEDKDFWTNQGVDFRSIVRATVDDVGSGEIVSGASTITQQLIKNAIVGPEVTLDRKLREMILALGLTQQMSKQDILTLYLNTIYYGEQAYGVDAAAQTYFSLQDLPGRPAAAQLDLAQASLLAGLPRAPSTLDPLVNLSAGLDRQQEVLHQMINQGYITPAQAAQAAREARQPNFLKPALLPNLAPHFSLYVLQELQTLMDEHALPASALSRSGLSIHTTLDLGLQNQILQIARNHVQAMEQTHDMTNAAEVLIDFHTGAILTLLGSIDFNDPNISGQFDVATQGYRQPGSSFKPFVYATAFEKGWSPGTAISDTPYTITLPPGSSPPTYSPQNYDDQFHGQMTIRYALQNSFNVPAVRTVMFAGVQNSLQTAEEMGISSYTGVPGPSMVLGGLNVTLLDETSAYGVFADGGVRMPPFAITSITNQQGQVVYQHQAQGHQAISPLIAGLITNTLSDNQARQYEFGACSPLMLYDGAPYSAACQRGNIGVVRPSAAKTGTTQDFRDNWTVGYTTDYVMGVWTGNNNGDPMIDVSGVDGAAPIWHDSMLVAEQGHPIQGFSMPHGLLLATVRYPDGVTSTDWYLPGTIPPGGIVVGHS